MDLVLIDCAKELWRFYYCFCICCSQASLFIENLMLTKSIRETTTTITTVITVQKDFKLHIAKITSILTKSFLHKFELQLSKKALIM